MTKAQRVVEAQRAAGWQGYSFDPKPSKCKACGEAIPPTQRRGNSFGGRGRAREFCDAICRKRWSRKSSTRNASRAAANTRRVSPARRDI